MCCRTPGRPAVRAWPRGGGRDGPGSSGPAVTRTVTPADLLVGKEFGRPPTEGNAGALQSDCTTAPVIAGTIVGRCDSVYDSAVNSSSVQQLSSSTAQQL